jgi:protein-disulfide isomerase
VKSEKGLDAEFATLDRMAMQQGQKHNLDAAKLQACIKAQNQDAIKASVKEGEAVGVEATPTMFVNGQKVDGALSLNELRAVLDSALEQAGVAVPPHAADISPAASQPSGK